MLSVPAPERIRTATAAPLAVTAEREFLRYKKVTADGRTAAVDPSDLYDLLHLDQRADRVLPNGWCMLPPRQVHSKGNACLTCDKFVTDASHRDELGTQLAQTEALITRRQTQFTARHGEPMAEDNIWLADASAKPALSPSSSWRSIRSASTTTGSSVRSGARVHPTGRNRPPRSQRNQLYEPAA
ncbi:hypothetical protein AMK17_25675 [Streptomyces sp. CB00072]|uniref:hypothetical protein n=1 Tax=Streptomyces sp. CB00072 TaxID=1703928 RepID=UPI00093DA047|nr:hypothetical protein [Streptomyces sp. CB00072]OKI53080.1 hypothetical protein AMK17_25675 [Streptomyces sp. CB00072]